MGGREDVYRFNRKAQMRLLGAGRTGGPPSASRRGPSGEQRRPGRERGLVTQLLLTFPSPLGVG